MNPRRTSTASPRLSLQKSLTFSPSPKLVTDLLDLEDARYMPRRSPTNYKTLEDWVEQTSTHTANDRLANYLKEQRVFTVPHIVVPDPMDIESRKEETYPHHHHHYSDSGIGSSVDTPAAGIYISQSPRPNSSSTNPIKDQQTVSTLLSHKSHSTIASAITRSFSSLPKSFCPEISPNGLNEIRERILKPILGNKDLAEFHPLINSIPEHVDQKNIANLRDLEKTFLYSAPVSLKTYLSACAVAYYHGRDVQRFSLSADSFEKFWDFSIRCLHSTVEYLNEKDQCRPTDRPYTNNYFLDLVHQIQRYAAIMARTREKEENGEELDDMDYSPYVPDYPDLDISQHSPSPVTHPSILLNYLFSCSSDNNLPYHSEETIEIQGGISTNGTPAELVRKKNGRSIPVAPEIGRMSPPTKRRHDHDDGGDDDEEIYDDDDEILRSMARRRKGDKGDSKLVCNQCGTIRARPCDMKKHLDSHTRKHKCSVKDCAYYEKGFPTSKERDRHVNDKHSSAPRMFECLYKPCSYSSKRESNCKQHMEKAHGWKYVRSKNNGRKKPVANSTSPDMGLQSPSTPVSPFAPSPMSSASHVIGTPSSAFAQSPFIQPENAFTGTEMIHSPQYDIVYGDRRDSNFTTTTSNSGMTHGWTSMDTLGQTFDTFNSPMSPLFNPNTDFLSVTNMQYQTTPSPNTIPDLTFDTHIPDGQDATMSPDAHNLTLIPNHADQVMMDEGYSEGGFLNGDFTLFTETGCGAQPNLLNFDTYNTGLSQECGYVNDMFNNL